MKKIYLLIALIITFILFSSCTISEKNEDILKIKEDTEKSDETLVVEDKEETTDKGEADKEKNTTNEDKSIDGKNTDSNIIKSENNETISEEFYILSKEEMEKIKPNELGEIMIIMYHGLSKKNATYSRTVESFKNDLEELYSSGFRLISLKDLVNGHIDIEAGYTPVVLTFDDGNRSNFNILEGESGEKIIDNTSVVGILKEFYEMHKDFGLEATFFLNGGIPFGQSEYVDYKLNYIVDSGMDIGNHSYNHGHFKTMNALQIEKTLAKVVKEYESKVNDYKIETLALPFGERPKDDEAREKLIMGSYDGIEYKNIAILNVGWRPSVSVFNKNFNPYSIMRVQSGDGDLQLRHWLDIYKEKPYLRFISDGNPNVITIKEKDLKRLDDRFKDKVITY